MVRVGEIRCEDRTPTLADRAALGRIVGGRDRRRAEVLQNLAGAGHGPERGHRHGVPGQVCRPGAGPVLVYLAEDALPVVRERVAGMARHRGLDLAGVEIHVITAPTLRLDRDPHRTRLLETAKRLRPRLLLLDPLVRLHGIDENNAGEVAGLLGLLPLVAAAVGPLGGAGASHPQERRGGSRCRPGASRFQRHPRLRRLQPLPPPQPGAAGVVQRAPRGAGLATGLFGLVATNPDTPIWRSWRSSTDGKRRSLEEQVLDNVAAWRGAHASKLRDCLAVKNERLGEALESLERAGRFRRTAAGWQRID